MNAQAPTFPPSNPPPRSPISERRARIQFVQDDQVFIDNLLVLWQGRVPILLATALGVFLGLAAKWIMPSHYLMSSVIEIGTIYGPEGQPTAIEQPDAVVTKLTRIHAYDVAREHARLTNDETFEWPLEASNPGRTGLILLATKTTGTSAPVHADLQRQTAERLVEAHRTRQERSRAELEALMTSERTRLQARKEELGRLAESRQRLTWLLSGAAGEGLSGQLGSSEAGVQGATSGVGIQVPADAPVGTAPRQLGQVEWSMLFQEHQRISGLERDTRSVLEACEHNLFRLQAQLALIQPTRVIAAPTRSERPQGSGPGVFALVGAFGGALLASLGIILARKLKARAV